PYPSSFPSHLRPRPGTAGRPSSSSSNSATSFYPNPNLPTTTTKQFYPPPPPHYPRAYYDGSSSPPGVPPSSAAEASPFYFAPPENKSSSSSSNSASPPAQANPRKRAFAGPDGPMHSYDELAAYSAGHQHPSHHHPSHTSNHPHQQHLDYDYGSESRPVSRRLSVMELCNEGSGAGEFVDGFLVNGERAPAVSTLGLVGGTAAMGIFDQDGRRPSPIGSVHGSVSARSERGSPPSRRVTPLPPSAHPHPHLNGGAPNGNGNGYPPPPRPHSTTFSVSSATPTHSPPLGSHHPQYATHPHQQQFGYPQQQQYSLLMSSLHPHQQHPYSPSLPTPHSATSYYTDSASSPRSASAFSPRVGGGGPMAHQQAHAFQALQAQQEGYGQGGGHAGYGGSNAGYTSHETLHGGGHGAGYVS
ncbi:hypothetical protein C0991_011045, partial [Blastosporella zonata]